MLFYQSDSSHEHTTRVELLPSGELPENIDLSEKERTWLVSQIELEKRIIAVNRFDGWRIFVLLSVKKEFQLLEDCRLDGTSLCQMLNSKKVVEILVDGSKVDPSCTEALLEGLALANYQFLKYKTKPESLRNSLSKVGVLGLNAQKLYELNTVVDAIFRVRDLVNEPASYLTAPKLAEECVMLGQKTGLQVEVFEKEKIESLKMGGLLAVNKASAAPPRFIVLTWDPATAVNTNPIVLVGKGIVYDTGGLSLKPTLNSMDEMKSDMAGAASVIGLLFAIARLKWPVKVIGLVPATDNSLDSNAYAPGDVITMFDGTTVEVLNTDAEGRLILADALSYAKKYQPELVIDLATLTGSAQMCLGSHASALMSNAGNDVVDALFKAGDETCERLVRLPLWDEYAKMIESDIADIKNIGGRMAGAITAAKFLEHFTDYPWVHLDIAGTAYLTSRENYRGIGGTGVGVRLLLNFVRNYIHGR